MPTTTNYGWTTPADTDLVKDGASAIRTLGTAIDTTVFNNAAAAIAKTIVDAKGDIIAATAADTVARLAVGANDTVLTADSSTATGLKWASPATGGYTLLSTTTLSGTSTTVSSISGSYKHLFIEVFGAKWGTGTGQLGIGFGVTNLLSRLLTGAGGIYTNYLITTDQVDDAAQSFNNSNGNNYLGIHLYNYASSSTYKVGTMVACWEGSSTNGRILTSVYGIATNTAVNSFVLSQWNGYTFSAGTIKVYGVN